MVLTVGDRLAHYDVTALIGEGGYGGGTVMSVSDRSVGDVVVLDVIGEMINDKEYGSVMSRVGELLGRGHLSLLLNLSQVPYMNSWGVGELATCFTSARNRHGKLKVAASQSRVTKMLAISKLDTLIEVFDTEAEALQSFDAAPPLVR